MVGVLFTGGKDSNFALHRALLSGQEVAALCTIRPSNPYSMLYHTPGINLVGLFSQAYGIPVTIVDSRGDEMEALEALLDECVERYGIKGIVTGALLSDYQRIRFTMKAYDRNLWVYNPLWRKSQEEYMRLLVELGFKFTITRIAAYGIPLRLLGRIITREEIEEIIRLSRKWGFNPAFEGGEAETLVLDAPLMKKKIIIEAEPRIKGESEGELVIKNAYLASKTDKNSYK